MVLAIINIRRLDSFLIVALVLITPFNDAAFMPREILGITGLNVFNILWGFAFSLIMLRVLVGKQPIESPAFFSVPILAFAAAYCFAVAWACIDIDSYPKTGSFTVTYK